MTVVQADIPSIKNAKVELDLSGLGTFTAGNTLSICLLSTSDAADERPSVNLGGRRIIKKKKQKKNRRSL